MFQGVRAFAIGRKSNRLAVTVPSFRRAFGIAAHQALLWVWVYVVIACDGVLEAADQRGESDACDLTFETDEGFIFDARVVSPRESKRSGAAVLLMGGELEMI